MSQRCHAGVHYFHPSATCDCALLTNGSQRAEGREGMVEVYNSFGQFLGCMGAETWLWLLSNPQIDVRDYAEPF